MNTSVMKMTDGKEYICIKEDKLAELEARADYKDKRISELYHKMEKMEEKLDKLNDNVNKLVLQSTKDDSQLELRLKAIETELALTKQAQKDNLETYKFWLAIVTVIFGVLIY